MSAGDQVSAKHVSLNRETTEKQQIGQQWRMFWMLLVLWLAIGGLELSNLVVGNRYPISWLYVLVVFPAATVFGWRGLWIAIIASAMMYHYTNYKTPYNYTEPEIIRLVAVALIGVGFARVSQDRQRIKAALAKLQRETQVREDLTNMLVHDLRTPLTGIITSLQTLQFGVLGELEPDQKEMVDFAVSDGQRLLGMVNQILDVARLEAGELPLQLQEVEVNEVAEQACRVMRPLADESGVTLKVECNGLRVKMDQELIQRVLVNLIGNAVKFTPHGQVMVESHKTGHDALLQVRDNGKGIPPEELPKIFDKYAQAQSGRKVKHSTGLGLTFCRLAVEAHGGRIWAESEIGKGTTINIQIPLSGPSGRSLAQQ